MNFYIKRNETVDQGVRRICLGQRTRLSSLLDDESLDPDTVVHELRKCTKKLRAALRISKPAMKKSGFRRTDKALKDFARNIGGTRDSAVMVKTFDCLADHFGTLLNMEELVKTRQSLRSRHVMDMANFQENLKTSSLKASVARLENELDRQKKYRLKRSMMRAAIRETYERGRDLNKALKRCPNTENSHMLRRQAKYLFYQLQLLRKHLSGKGLTAMKKLEKLGALLGDDNDMSVLVEHLKSNPDLAHNPAQVELLCSLAETRRISLLSAALKISCDVYSDRPSKFVDDLFS